MADVVDRIAPSAAPAKPVEHHSPNTIARGHINVLRRAINGDPAEEDDITEALNGLLKRFEKPSLPDPSEDDNVVRCDKAELEEALARARCGQIRDCVIHLGRALPNKFSGIADAMERDLGGAILKLVIERTDLLKAVDPAAKVIQRRNTTPILNNIRIAAEGSQITVTATDLEIEIRTMAPAGVDVAGAITVPADHLLDLIRRMPDGSQISFELEPDTRLSMRCGRSHTRLPTLPASDYPDIAPGEMTHRFDIAGDDLTTLLRDTVFAASNEPTLPTYCGVHWHQIEAEDGPRLAAVSTDGSRMLARRAMPLPEGSSGFPPITLPTKTVSEITRLVDKTKGEIAIALCDSKIRVIIGETVLTSNLILGNFVDYTRIVPKSTTNTITVEAAPLLAAVERVNIIADRDNIRSTTFAFDDRKLTLTMANNASADLREEVPCDFEGEPFKIGYDHRLLAKLLGVIGGDTVLMQVGDDITNTIFSTRANSDLYVLLAKMAVK